MKEKFNSKYLKILIGTFLFSTVTMAVAFVISLILNPNSP